MSDSLSIRNATANDAGQVAAIYNHYIENTTATFEETPLSFEEMAERIERVIADYVWLVAETGGRIEGYAYAKPFHERAAYRHTVESTVYLAEDCSGRGLGTRLYAELFRRLKAFDVHVVIGGITMPNPASVALHERFGMQRAAYYRQVGRKFDRWLDVGYWQMFLNGPAEDSN